MGANMLAHITLNIGAVAKRSFLVLKKDIRNKGIYPQYPQIVSHVWIVKTDPTAKKDLS
jgi:hypothetical protein